MSQARRLSSSNVAFCVPQTIYIYLVDGECEYFFLDAKTTLRKQSRSLGLHIRSLDARIVFFSYVCEYSCFHVSTHMQLAPSSYPQKTHIANSGTNSVIIIIIDRHTASTPLCPTKSVWYFLCVPRYLSIRNFFNKSELGLGVRSYMHLQCFKYIDVCASIASIFYCQIQFSSITSHHFLLVMYLWSTIHTQNQFDHSIYQIDATALLMKYLIFNIL